MTPSPSTRESLITLSFALLRYFMFNISLFIIHDNKSIIHTYNSVTSQIVNNTVLGEKKVGHLVKTSQRDECRLTDTRCMIKLEPKSPLPWRPKICRLFLYWERSYITHIIEYCMHTWIWTLVLKQTKNMYMTHFVYYSFIQQSVSSITFNAAIRFLLTCDMFSYGNIWSNFLVTLSSCQFTATPSHE